jgi:hypothetical protein
MIDIDCLIQHPRDDNKVIWYNRGEIILIGNQESLVKKSLTLSDLIDLLIMLGYDYVTEARPIGNMVFSEVLIFCQKRAELQDV